MKSFLLTAFVSLSICPLAFAQEQKVDTSPLPYGGTEVFGDVNWTDWDSGEGEGLVKPLRPIVVTHAGDGSNRTFIATQRGVVHVIPDSGEGDTEVFLDIQDKVAYNDKTNEEGFLGMAFHPNYRENGEVYVYYTNLNNPHQNVVSRFKVDPDNPNQALTDSEEQLLVLDKPFWNHDGGTLCFGPDGFLYIAIGDGGLGKDPFKNGQNLKTYLGAILRIDVDNEQDGLPYAIPTDNPFADRDDALGEIYAYGIRNVWRMAFDPATGTLWAADVGQDLWEEINLIEKGGNYGWNIREGMHPFGEDGVEAKPELKEPIWEYSHDVGKSITGGVVYRGKAVPELEGAYLYADYVTMKLWALWYDAETGEVIANRELKSPGEPIITFGEDEAGEVYFTTVTPSRGAIYQIAPLNP